MSKTPFSNPLFSLSTSSDEWKEKLAAVTERFDRQYQNQPLELPTEVQAMPIFQEWLSGTLAKKAASPFWEIAPPQKNQHCLDIGCGVSFLIYPWRDWQAFFHGQEISHLAQEILNARGSQLNSKLFKGVVLAPAHQLNFAPGKFDLVIATGWSCYYQPSYWKAVLLEVKRVLKPEGHFVFDILNPETPAAEDWAVLETYLGAEVFLKSVGEWEKTWQEAGAKVVARQSGELFDLYKVGF